MRVSDDANGFGLAGAVVVVAGAPGAGLTAGGLCAPAPAVKMREAIPRSRMEVFMEVRGRDARSFSSQRSTFNTFSHQLPGSGASVRSSKRVNSLRKVRGMSSVAPLRFLAMMSVALPSASALASSVSA